MRKPALLVVTVLVLLATVSVMAQYKAQPNPGGQGSSPLIVPNTQAAKGTFPRISIADALKLHREGKAVFVDVRSNEQFSYGHIKGALSIPGSQIVKRFSEVPPQKVVITYCACDAEQSSGRAASELLAHGVRNVFALKGGWNEWKRAGHPSAAGPK